MKFLDKFNLVLFSILILTISLIICLLSFGWLGFNLILQAISFLATNTIASNTLLVVSIILIILSIKSIFFNSSSKEEMKTKEGILLENDNGKLLVSKDTIESLTNTVVKSFESAESVMTKVEVDNESHIKIYITLFVYSDAIIKELSNKLQTNVKDTIKKSLDLDVTEVNIRVKNISVKKEPNIKE
ncbi:MAG: alkaline shock response membrane anchor protein AmaP [Clostridia bacterium]|nr:alkaline shock response membrane anchor protein AmaP [Clostridia bacterium]